MKRGKQQIKQYELGKNAGIRLTANSGATQEVINWFNITHETSDNLSREVIEAIKLKIDMEKHYTKAQIERIRHGSEIKASYELKSQSEASLDVSNERSKTKEDLIEYKKIQHKEEIIESNAEEELFGQVKRNSEDELFGQYDYQTNHILEEKNNKREEISDNKRPGIGAFNSIRRMRNEGK